MKTWVTKNGITIHRVWGLTYNVYLVSNGEKFILVDTGKCTGFKRLTKTLESIVPKDKKINFLILTHSHYDHCQNAARLKEEVGCKIIMSKHEEEYASKGYTPIPNGTLLFTRILTSIGKRIGKSMFGFPPFSPDITVDDELSLNQYGLNIRIIGTPGHSVGSVSVLIDNEIAIVGDAMFGFFMNSILPPFADDAPEMKISWKKLYNTDCRLFLPGHGQEIRRETVKHYLKKLSES